MKKGLQIAFSVVFLLLITVPFVAAFFGNDEVLKDENRELKPFPEADIRFLDKFPKQYDAYWSDHFGFREFFIDKHHVIKKDILGVSPVHDQVIFGKDGWYFMKGKPYKCFTGLNKFTEAELKEGKQQLQKRADFAKSQGVPYIIFVAPNKHRIYTEKLPFHVRQLTDSIQLDQLIEIAKNIDGIEVIDLAPALIDFKNTRAEGRHIYEKTDNHWNALGGFVAYQQMVLKMKSLFPNIPNPYNLSDYNLEMKEGRGGALARYLKSEETIREKRFFMSLDYDYKLYADTAEFYTAPEGFWYPEEYERRTINLRDTTLPKVLWFRDSFGRLVAPHLQHNFGYTLEIFDSWRYRLNEDIIINEKPDAVIMLILERNLKCLMTGGDCGGNF